MTEKLDPIMPKITGLLRIVFGKGATDPERLNAIGRIDQCLKSADSDAHDLIGLIEKPRLSDDDMQKIFNAGYTKRKADEAAEKTSKRASFFSTNRNTNYSYTSSVINGNGTGRIRGSDVFNGYNWSDIARHCTANITRIPDAHREFVEDMADQLSRRGISTKQAQYLGNLFGQYFSGRIQ